MERLVLREKKPTAPFGRFTPAGKSATGTFTRKAKAARPGGMVWKEKTKGGEEVEEIINLVTEVGTQVTVILACFWFINKETEKNREERNKIMESHKEEQKAMADAISNNTIVMEQILEVLRKENTGNENV